MPKVSICLPTLNSIKFLEDRINSILSQTLTDWEIIVFDSFSNDGTFEYLSGFAEKDQRFRIHQSKPDGIYTNINRCIEKAMGEFVYIATSDDTMPSNCLEELVRSLQENPTCDIAHSKPRVIDENNRELPDWWSERSIFAKSSGDLVKEKHIRHAPLDGLLHLLGESVYISLTQFLYRRSIYDKVGLFKYKWGSIGDFNWHMRASLICNTVHTPYTHGDWRVHQNQATANANLGESSHSNKVEGMIEHAIKNTEERLSEHIHQKNLSDLIKMTRSYREYFRGLSSQGSNSHRKRYILRKLLSLSPIAYRHVYSQLSGNSKLPERAFDLVFNCLLKQNRKTISTF